MMRLKSLGRSTRPRVRSESSRAPFVDAAAGDFNVLRSQCRADLIDVQVAGVEFFPIDRDLDLPLAIAYEADLADSADGLQILPDFIVGDFSGFAQVARRGDDYAEDGRGIGSEFVDNGGVGVLGKIGAEAERAGFYDGENGGVFLRVLAGGDGTVGYAAVERGAESAVVHALAGEVDISFEGVEVGEFGEHGVAGVFVGCFAGPEGFFELFEVLLGDVAGLDELLGVAEFEAGVSSICAWAWRMAGVWSLDLTPEVELGPRPRRACAWRRAVSVRSC